MLWLFYLWYFVLSWTKLVYRWVFNTMWVLYASADLIIAEAAVCHMGSISCSDYVGSPQCRKHIKMSLSECIVNGKCTNLLPVHTPFVVFSMFVGIEQMSIEGCCKDGQSRGNDNEDCAALPLISESTTCRWAGAIRYFALTDRKSIHHTVYRALRRPVWGLFRFTSH